MSEAIIADASDRMDKAVEAFGHTIATIRTGRAHTSLVEHLSVAHYGQTMPLNQLATLAAPDAQLITVQPWDRGAVDSIVKAIQLSDLEAAWRRSGERFWRMPLEAELRELLDSEIADIKNIGERWGGAITAALFLQEFVQDDVPRWAHLDIAGPVLSNKDKGYVFKGGTGFAVRTLVEYVLARARK